MNATLERPTPGTVYSFDFKAGRMVPLVTAARFPLGAVLTYENRSCDRLRHVVTSAEPESYGQPTLCEDGHRGHCAAPCDGHQWRDTGEVLTPDELAEFKRRAQAEGARLKAEAELIASEDARQRAETTARIIRENPHLERTAGSKKTPWALAASNIRKELARAFPGIKFSVTSDAYSMGCCVDVRWTLGPTSEQVKAISDKYQTDDFNGMEDISESRRSVWPGIFGGAKSVSENRDDGDAVNVVSAGLCDLWGIPQPADGKSFWNLYRDNDHSGHGVSIHARQIINSMAYPPGAVITGVESCPEREGDNLYGCARYYRPTFTAPEVVAPTPKAATVREPRETTTAEPVTVAGATMTENEEKNGVEIRFPGKPAAAVLDSLKAAGWRWSRFSGCWYNRRTPETLSFARAIANA
jgi:hypothetical protein